ncbi:hypothetical protein EVAR_53329_1 [Eumeta japonica]|uniref:Uncharacterized protein n=1 Tax=Eumeta variegata TaxID=151549 RepID=A0A4C1XA80_EUMVA|nr:hypothetical protein EVAR_53329_1 [Eumeta japonica]
MLVKTGYPMLLATDVYPGGVYGVKELSYGGFVTECIQPRSRRPRRSLPPLPEDKECSNMEFRRSSKMALKRRRHRRQCLKLPSLPEHDECEK